MSIPITDKLLKSYEITKKFTATQPNQISNLNFDDSGRFLLSTNFNQSIQLFDTSKGKHLKAIQSQKYGAHLAKFTHSTQNCIYSSTKTADHTIRYLSLIDNSFIRYFKGHTGFVNSIEVSPTHDVFVSSSLDSTVKLWDLRASNPQVSKTFENSPPTATAIDPSGLVVAITDAENNVYLHSLNSLTSDHFLKFTLPLGFQFNKFEFSNDNKYILFSSINGDHLIADSYDGVILMRLSGVGAIPPIEVPTSGTACFSPDGKYVLSGSSAGTVLVYRLDAPLKEENGEKFLYPLFSLGSKYDQRPRMVSFNPKFQQFVTADVDVNMWLPDSF